MITVESCRFIQEAIFKEKAILPDGTEQYRFSIPTLTPLIDHCRGESISKSNLINKNLDPILVNMGYIETYDTITLKYNVERFGEPTVGESFAVCFLGGDLTRCTILERM